MNDVISFPIVVSGPSGVGKTTLCHGLLSRDEQLVFSISATTRQPRESEVHGKDYFFVSYDEFERMRQSGELAEWAFVHGEYYGTPKEWLDQKLSAGLSVLLDIDVQGGIQIMKAYPRAVSIFVVPPSFAVLEERLRGRGSDDDQSVRLRLANARKEMGYIDKYGFIVVNDRIEDAVSRMQCIVRAERLRRDRLLDGKTWQDLVGLQK
ncbi:MAG: guanylate kinase [bacterium]